MVVDLKGTVVMNTIGMGRKKGGKKRSLGPQFHVTLRHLDCDWARFFSGNKTFSTTLRGGGITIDMAECTVP